MPQTRDLYHVIVNSIKLNQSKNIAPSAVYNRISQTIFKQQPFEIKTEYFTEKKTLAPTELKCA